MSISNIKEIYEINAKDNSNKELYEEALEKLNAFEFKDKRLNSLIIFIIYGYNDFNIENKNNIIYLQKENIKYNEEQDIKITLLKAQFSHIENKYIIDGKLNIKIIIAFNCSKEEVENKYFNKKENENSIKLNVFPTEPKYNINQIILNDSTFEEIQKSTVMIKNIQKIYYDWGFAEVDPVPRCIINFYGPPGTGKTMSAHIVASELGIKILPLNYSDIESKFVGDAPKNLVQAFEIAKKENCLLFFDEADSFLGKRITNVSSSSDQAVNSLRSQMLILLESFNGVVIFATNLHENYDSAFESRILRHIKFELPDKYIRLRIIKKMLPDKAPIDKEVLEDEFLLSLSEIIDGFSPREIKNTILEVFISSIQKNANMNKELFNEVFNKAKEKFEELKTKSNVRKENLKLKIKENLETNNYNIQSNDAENETDKLENKNQGVKNEQ